MNGNAHELIKFSGAGVGNGNGREWMGCVTCQLAERYNDRKAATVKRPKK
jgi:hypothetical protein